MVEFKFGRTIFKVMFLVFGCFVLAFWFVVIAIYLMVLINANTQPPHDIHGIVIALTFMFGALNITGFALVYSKLKLISKRLDQMEDDQAMNTRAEDD